MDHSLPSVQAILMIGLLLLSAFFSGSETAMMAVNRIRLRYRVKRERRARLLKETLKYPEKLISTLLFCNNLVNVALSAIGTSLAIRLWGDTGIAYATVGITIALLVFSEITPKTIAAYHPTRIALVIVPVISVCIRFLYPIVRILTAVSNLFIRALGLRPPSSADQITEEEIRTVIEAGGDDGVLDRAKHDMLMGIMTLEETTVGDIMVPLRDVVALPLEASREQVYRTIRKTQASRYPVYQSTPNNIIGFIHVRDLLLQPEREAFSLKTILREPHFVPNLRSIRQQLLSFQQEQSHLSLIVDEYGNIQGIVTLEDILEEIVGEISDEHDLLSQNTAKLPDGSYRLQGGTLIRDINRWLRLQIPEEEVRTIAGIILKELGRIPEPGDTVSIGSYRLQVEQITGKSIGVVRLWIEPQGSAESGTEPAAE